MPSCATSSSHVYVFVRSPVHNSSALIDSSIFFWVSLHAVIDIVVFSSRVRKAISKVQLPCSVIWTWWNSQAVAMHDGDEGSFVFIYATRTSCTCTPVTCTCTVFCFSSFPLSVVADISHRTVNIFIQFQLYILFLSNNHLHITLFTSLYTFPLPSKKTTFWHTSHYSKKATTLNKNFKVSTSIKYSSVSTQKTWADSNR